MKDSLLKHEIRLKLNNDELFRELYTHLELMEKRLTQLCVSDNLDLTLKLKKTINSGGKRLRPMLAYFCYRAGEDKSREIIPLMCMLELMHTASLIHDDVVDNSDERRGKPTINKTSGKFAAVQYGDYLLAKAMESLHLYRGTGINEALSQVSSQMCLGEFLQMENQFHFRNMAVEDYFLQIKRKTAYLLGTSCFTGALAGGCSQREAKAYRNYGENLGIAFQLKDDLLDLMGDSSVGKPLYQDIKSGIFTLPLLHLKELNPPSRIINLLEKRDKNDGEVKEIVNYLQDTDAINYTKFVLRKYSQYAEQSLEDLENSQEKAALIELARSLVERKM